MTKDEAVLLSNRCAEYIALAPPLPDRVDSDGSRESLVFGVDLDGNGDDACAAAQRIHIEAQYLQMEEFTETSPLCDDSGLIATGKSGSIIVRIVRRNSRYAIEVAATGLKRRLNTPAA